MHLFLSSDDEGNSPGAAFLQWDKSETVKDWKSNNRNYTIPVGVMASHEYYNKLNLTPIFHEYDRSGKFVTTAQNKTPSSPSL